MAVDRKADYVGNHGGAYTDINGMSKQFTTIDHDKKTKISSALPTEGAVEEYRKFLVGYRARLIKRITDISASLCPTIFSDYTVRGAGMSSIEWNTDMLLDAGVPIKQLGDLCTLLENKVDLIAEGINP